MAMNWKKIINDPVHGFISIPTKTIFQLIEQPEFQRLRRIKQLGLTHMVYPGAIHTRFHHALGAMHLMNDALLVLQSKGVHIDEEEFEGALIAILLHDIGHGPYSHALERMFIDADHEDISLAIMHRLNDRFDGHLKTAIAIFSGTYHKPFLNELVSSQLDVDRMDYLSRDSFFTGVAEGVIGHDRLIKMMHVDSGHIVLEEKGLYSIEKFLLARRLMYLQVYLHKTVISAEQMLKLLVRMMKLSETAEVEKLPEALQYFFIGGKKSSDLKQIPAVDLDKFLKIDDIDIDGMIKKGVGNTNDVIKITSNGLLNRNLFRNIVADSKPNPELLEDITMKIVESLQISPKEAEDFIITGIENVESLSNEQEEIKIRRKNGRIESLENLLKRRWNSTERKFFLCFPKLTVY